MLLNCTPVLFPKYFALSQKALCNAMNLALYKPFDL